MSTITVQNIQGSSSSSNTINVASGHKISGATGSIVTAGMSIQQLHQTITAYFTTSATSLVATGFELTITPKYASSLIKCTVGFNGLYCAQQNTGWRLELMKNGSSIAYLDDVTGYGISNQNANQGFNPTHVYFDNPNTTSATTYAIHGNRNGGSGNAHFNNYITGNNRTRSWFTVEELAQ